MFEQIANLENKTQEYNFSQEKNTNLVLQFMVDGYLRRKEQPSMKELLAADGFEDKPGVIYNYHVSLIQTMIAEELLLVGINLSDEVNKTGEKFELGVLSNYEVKYINNKLENVVGLIDVIRERVSK